MGSVEQKLFSPIQVGRLTLAHRVVLAPLTRFRSTEKTHVPLDICVEYYGQRASMPGTLLISEGTFIAEKTGGYDHVPGIWSEEQISAWRKVTDEVHSKGSYIFCQLWALGRCAKAHNLSLDGHPYVSSSPTPFKNTGNDWTHLVKDSDQVARALSREETREYVELYAQAAHNAVYRAGFDGVEIHGANGYLIDQFTQDVVNKREDEYGGSIANRCRLALEVIHAVVDRIGADRVGLRLSPWSTFQEMRMADPVPQFTALINKLPDIAYLHMIEPRVHGDLDQHKLLPHENLDFAREAWKERGRKGPFISAGGYTPESALKHVEKEGMPNEMVAFGRWFISNPDLPMRIKNGLELSPYNRETIYSPESAEGYTDYPIYEEIEDRYPRKDSVQPSNLIAKT